MNLCSAQHLRHQAASRWSMYSREVQQPAGIPQDRCARPRTVSCGDGCRWTCCLLFASRGSGGSSPPSSTCENDPGWIIKEAIDTSGRHSLAVLGSASA